MQESTNLFNHIISVENLLSSWYEFLPGKRRKPDVMRFEFDLEVNIFRIARDLSNRIYKHDRYEMFYLTDPKLRQIHKSLVRDRIVHHALFRILNPIFEPTFIPTSFSCQIGKGNHAGVNYLEKVIRKVSRNHTRACFVLKCDVRKFFDSIDHGKLLDILGRRIKDESTMWLLMEVVASYSKPVFTRERERE